MYEDVWCIFQVLQPKSACTGSSQVVVGHPKIYLRQELKCTPVKALLASLLYNKLQTQIFTDHDLNWALPISKNCVLTLRLTHTTQKQSTKPCQLKCGSFPRRTFLTYFFDIPLPYGFNPLGPQLLKWEGYSFLVFSFTADSTIKRTPEQYPYS